MLKLLLEQNLALFEKSYARRSVMHRNNQVDQTHYEGSNDGNLLYNAVKSKRKDHVVALIEHG